MPAFSPRGYKNPATTGEINDPAFWKTVGENQDARWLEAAEDSEQAKQDAAQALATLGAVKQEAAEAKAAAQQSASASSSASAASAASAAASNAAADTVERFGDDVELLKQMAEITPGSVTDAQTALLIQDPATETNARLNAQIVQAMDGLTGGAGAGLAPLFLPTLSIGAQAGGPANARTGLGPGTMPGGGPAEEMSVPVTGARGATTLTSTDAAKVAGFGTGRWIGAVTSGSDDIHVHVTGVSAGGVVNLRDPLPIDVDGFLSARYDDATSGQHMTRRATRAYVQHLLNVSPVVGGRGGILDGAWTTQPVSLQDLWAKNAALAAVTPYNVVAGGIVRVSTVDTPVPLSPHEATTGTPYALGSESNVRVGTDGVGQGATASFTPGRTSAVLAFGVGAERIGHDPHTASVRVTVTADGRTILDRTQTGWLRTYEIPLAGMDNVTVEVTNQKAEPRSLIISETTLRVSGVNAPPQGKGKIVTLGDSWMAWYDGEFGKALAAKTGATVINHSLGGMTTEWGLAWWDEYVAKEKPDEVWLHFFTNDDNKLTAQTFTAPDGTERPMWTTTDTAETRRIWRDNIWEMIRRGQEQGIRVVVVMPSATVGAGQTFRHMQMAHLLELPPLDPSYIASPKESADPAWHGNQVGKHQGKQLQIGSSTTWAESEDPAAAWTNPALAGLLGLQRNTLSRAKYVIEPATLTQQDWGTPGAGADTVTITPVAGVGTKFTVNWAANGGGGHRLSGDIPVIAGRTYLSVLRVIDATGTRMSDSGSTVTGSYVTFGLGSLTGGSANLINRGVAGTSATRSIGAGQTRTNGSTTEFTVTTLAAIDVTALLDDAPNLSTLTDTELADFALSLE